MRVENYINPAGVNFTGGAIDGTVIGGRSPADVTAAALHSTGAAVVGSSLSAATTSGGNTVIFDARVNSGNNDNLQILCHSYAANPSAWSSVSSRIQRLVDATYMSFIEFAADAAGNGTATRIGSGNSDVYASFSAGQSSILTPLQVAGGVNINANQLWSPNDTLYLQTSSPYGAYIGNGLFVNGGISSSTIQIGGSLSLNSNQIWSPTDTLYLQTSSGRGVYMGGSLTVSGSLTLNGASSDPDGGEGKIYFNSTSKTFRAYANGGWHNLSLS